MAFTLRRRAHSYRDRSSAISSRVNGEEVVPQHLRVFHRDVDFIPSLKCATSRFRARRGVACPPSYRKNSERELADSFYSNKQEELIPSPHCGGDFAHQSVVDFRMATDISTTAADAETRTASFLFGCWTLRRDSLNQMSGCGRGSFCCCDCADSLSGNNSYLTESLSSFSPDVVAHGPSPPSRIGERTRRHRQFVGEVNSRVNFLSSIVPDLRN